MNRRNRRAFLQTSMGALAASLGPTRFAARSGVTLDHLAGEAGRAQTAPAVAANQGRKPLRLGLIIGIGKAPETAVAKVHDLGLPTCQVYVEDFEQGLSTRLLQALDKHQIEPTSVVVGGPGREVWDFYEGPLTIGVVPRDTRAARID